MTKSLWSKVNEKKTQQPFEPICIRLLTLVFFLVETLIGNSSPLSGLSEVDHLRSESDEYLDNAERVLNYEKYILTSFTFEQPSYLRDIELLAASKGPIRIQVSSLKNLLTLQGLRKLIH